jgi:peroxiredoxin
MANSHYPDKTIIKTLADGTVEFHLQKIPQEGAMAPQFTVKTLDGKIISSAEMKGKVAVLSFWFIGCPACMEMEPQLNAFKAKFAGKDDIVFLAMTADPTPNVKKYLSKERFDYIQAADAKAAMDSFVSRCIRRTLSSIVRARSSTGVARSRLGRSFDSVVKRALEKN